jgi:hypothetical protein
MAVPKRKPRFVSSVRPGSASPTAAGNFLLTIGSYAVRQSMVHETLGIRPPARNSRHRVPRSHGQAARKALRVRAQHPVDIFPISPPGRGRPDPRQASSGSNGVDRQSDPLGRRISFAPHLVSRAHATTSSKVPSIRSHRVLRSKERSSSGDHVTAHPKSSGPAARFSAGRSGPHIMISRPGAPMPCRYRNIGTLSRARFRERARGSDNRKSEGARQSP